MSSNFYKSLASSAKRMIAKYGMSVVIQRPTTSINIPGLSVEELYVEVEVKAIRKEIKEDTVLVMVDKVTLQDRIKIGLISYTVIEVIEKAPADQSLVYFVKVKV